MEPDFEPFDVAAVVAEGDDDAGQPFLVLGHVVAAGHSWWRFERFVTFLK